MSGKSWTSEIVYPVAPLLEIMAENGTHEGTSAVAFSQLLEGLRELGVTDEAIRNTFEYEFTKEVKE
ncbi:MAG: hypothetical protein ACREGB_03815 [Candidatus Saccharimonadales bacterium]